MHEVAKDMRLPKQSFGGNGITPRPVFGRMDFAPGQHIDGRVPHAQPGLPASSPTMSCAARELQSSLNRNAVRTTTTDHHITSRTSQMSKCAISLGPADTPNNCNAPLTNVRAVSFHIKTMIAAVTPR